MQGSAAIKKCKERRVNHLQAEQFSLIQRAASGDSAAFEALVMPHEKMMYALALRLCREPEDAKDCMQEAMLRIYRSLSSFRGDSSLSTWIYRIVNNVCLDCHRRRKVRAAESLDQLSEDGWNPSDPQLGPEASLENQMLKAALARGIRALPDGIREAVIMRDVNGLSYEEIAETLDINIGTVKSRINRGREKLRNFLQESGELS